MLDSVFVDVGLGVVFVYFVMASSLAAVNEWASRVLQARSKAFWSTLRGLLEEGGDSIIKIRDVLTVFLFADDRRPEVVAESTGTPATGTVVDQLANSTVVKPKNAAGRSRKVRRPYSRNGPSGPITRVDHLDAETFTVGLLELAKLGERQDLRMHVEASSRALALARTGHASSSDVVRRWGLVQHPHRLAELLRAIGQEESLAEPVKEAAEAWGQAAAHRRRNGTEDEQLLETAQAATPESLDQLIRVLPDDDELAAIWELKEQVAGSPLEKVLDKAMAHADANLGGVMDSVAAWFDQSMADSVELYRRNSRKRLFVLGLVVAIAANVSTIDLVQDLRRSSENRSALAAAGSCETGIQVCYREAVDLVTLPLLGDYEPPWVAFGLGAEDPEEKKSSDPIPKNPGSGGQTPTGAVGQIFTFAFERLGPMQVVLGWLLTAFAVSFGAPFWFDLARRVGANRRTRIT